MTGTPPAKTKTPERARPMWPAWLFLATLVVSHPVIVLVRYLPFDEGNVLALGHVLLWTLASALMVIILPTYHTSPRRRVLLLIPVAMIVGVFAGIPVHRVGTGWYARQLAPAVEALHRHQAETGSPAPSLDVLPRGTIPPHLPPSPLANPLPLQNHRGRRLLGPPPLRLARHHGFVATDLQRPPRGPPLSHCARHPPLR